jgi:hypothetical protein
MTEHHIYMVRSAGDRWSVSLNDETLGTFARRHEAVRAAVTVAEASGRTGGTAEIRSVNESGEMFAVWEVGRDVFSAL